jgi:hypothetical protein
MNMYMYSTTTAQLLFSNPIDVKRTKLEQCCQLSSVDRPTM